MDNVMSDAYGRPVNNNGEPIHCECAHPNSPEFRELQKQVAEIHAFIKGVGEALNNPMLKSMLPPNMRDLV